MKFVIAATLAASVSSKCYKGIEMSYFKDKDCTEAYQYKKGENVTYSIDEEEATKMNNDCNVLTTPERVQLEPLVPGYKYDPSSMSVTCSTSNMETKLF